MARKAISKRLRFEIFKRDGFKCKYCGATNEAAQLHVDHIIPVSGGGSNDPLNLVTACISCNSGKSDVPLSSVPESIESRHKAEKKAKKSLESMAKTALEKQTLSISASGRLPTFSLRRSMKTASAKTGLQAFVCLSAAWICMT